MKKWITWALGIAVGVFMIDWVVIGLKLLDGNYDILTEAYIGAACWGVALVCAVCKVFTNRCPHCGKLRQSNGKYCPHCGREV